MRAERFHSMPRALRAWAVAFAVLVPAACDLSPTKVVPLVTVEQRPFEIKIQGFGELEAASATSIEIPPTLRGIQRIAWIAEEGSIVRAGEVVARLDPENIDRRVYPRRNSLRKIEYQVAAKRQEIEKQTEALAGQLRLLQQERVDAEATAPRDPQLFSRQEIIDAQIDIDLIDAKIAHVEKQLERATAKAETDLAILDSQRKTEQVQLDQLEAARQQLEIHAPHDGFFLPGTTWQGEKVRTGMQLWGGQSLGKLPDVSVMQAKLYILESEAAGLAENLQTQVRLDAHPGLSVGGTVKTVQPVANAIEEDSPVKYFEVVVALDETDPVRMRPGSQVTATIWVSRDDARVSVPNQAIFVEGSESWVWVREPGGFTKRVVELGPRSLSRTAIAGGLEAGETIALVDPTAGGASSG